MTRWVLGRAIDEVDRKRKHDASHVRGTFDAIPCAAWLVTRVALLLAAVIGGIALATPAAAQVSDQPPAVRAYTLTPERIVASGAAVVGLIGAVIGGLALVRSAGRIGAGNGRRGAMMALIMGPIGVVIGGLVVATADGGLGTGNGLGGGIVAVVAGLIAMALGGLALARTRRIA